MNTGRMFSCCACGLALRADLFNAFFRPQDQPRIGLPVQAHGQAECFNHPGRRAKVPCAACGRLLCELCEVALDGRSLCFNCLQAGRDQKITTRLETRRTLYDNIALTLALAPVVLVFPTIVTAPAAIYVALRHWKRAPAVLPRSRWRLVLAMVLAAVQIVGWFVFFIRILG